jgi:hypothetical protein
VPTTRQNGIETPVGSDAYNLTTGLAKMADTTNAVIICANATARNALTPHEGMIVTRLDRSGALEVYRSGSWRLASPISTSGFYNVSTTSSTPYVPNTITLPSGLFTVKPNVQVTWEAASGLPPRLRTFNVGTGSFGVNVMSDVGEVTGTVHWTATQNVA